MDNEQLEEVIISNEGTDKINTELPNFTQKKNVTLDETITLQAIICVVISILFIAANMFAPEIAAQLSDSFKENYSLSDEKTDKALETFLEFINSKPVFYD